MWKTIPQGHGLWSVIDPSGVVCMTRESYQVACNVASACNGGKEKDECAEVSRRLIKDYVTRTSSQHLSIYT